VRFRRTAKAAGHDEQYIVACLEYANRLYFRSLPIIFDQTHFSYLAGYSLNYILGATNAKFHFYRQFDIRKRSGGVRTISEPLPSLKEIQRWILENILEKIEVHPAAKGFVRNKSIRDNARFHRNQPKLLSMDIEDFFGSINKSMINAIFNKIGYSAAVSKLLTELCSLYDSLPQGAPTSPALSNIVCRSLDKRFLGFALKNGFRYTRYADDISFSGDLPVGSLIQFVRKVLNEHGFQVNDAKTRLMHKGRQQKVTGIIVNEKLQAPRLIRRKLRQEVFFIKKFGLDTHLRNRQISKGNHIKFLIGRANYIVNVNPNDKEAREYLGFLRELDSSSE